LHPVMSLLAQVSYTPSNADGSFFSTALGQDVQKLFSVAGIVMLLFALYKLVRAVLAGSMTKVFKDLALIVVSVVFLTNAVWIVSLVNFAGPIVADAVNFLSSL